MTIEIATLANNAIPEPGTSEMQTAVVESGALETPTAPKGKLTSLFAPDGSWNVDEMSPQQYWYLMTLLNKRCQCDMDEQEESKADLFYAVVRDVNKHELMTLMTKMNAKIGIDFWKTGLLHMYDSVLADKEWIRMKYEERCKDDEASSNRLNKIRSAMADFTEAVNEEFSKSPSRTQRQLAAWTKLSKEELWPYMVQIVPLKKSELQSLWDAPVFTKESAAYKVFSAKYDLNDFLFLKSNKYVPVRSSFMERWNRVGLMKAEWIEKRLNATSKFIEETSATLSEEQKQLFDFFVGTGLEEHVLIGDTLLSNDNE